MLARRMRGGDSLLLLVCLVLAGFSASAREARAGDEREEATSKQRSRVEGVSIVVPSARGPASSGAEVLTQSLRKHLAARLRSIVPAKKLSMTQRRLKQTSKNKFTLKSLIDAARVLNAEYVLDVTITKKKRVHTAHALLFHVPSAAIHMDFRSDYVRRRDATDRGRRIAERTVQKLEMLLPAEEDPEPSVGALMSPSKDSEAGSAGAIGSTTGGSADRGAGAGAPIPTPIAPTEPSIAPMEPSIAPAGTAPAEGAVALSATPGSEDRADDVREILRFSLAAGSGLLYTYDVSAPSVPHSRLSYRLEPLALLEGGLEIGVPGTPLGFKLSATFRPVRYQVSVGEQPSTTPGGSLLDVAGMVAIHIALSGKGPHAPYLIPSVGARAFFSRTETDATNNLLSSTAIAPSAGLAARMPLAEALELELGIDGGIVAMYTESPNESGDPAGGFYVGGDLKGRIWLTSVLAIAIDTRFSLERMTFDGTPTRRRPADENLTDPSISIKDLRTSLGLGLRL